MADGGYRTAVGVRCSSGERTLPQSIAYKGKWTNQSGVVVLTPRHYEITGIVSLVGAPTLQGRPRFHGLALRKCGRPVANASWVVLFAVPAAQTVRYSTGAAFLAPTSRGWRLWYPLILRS